MGHRCDPRRRALLANRNASLIAALYVYGINAAIRRDSWDPFDDGLYWRTPKGERVHSVENVLRRSDIRYDIGLAAAFLADQRE